MLDYEKLPRKFPELFSNVDAPIRIITDPVVIAQWQERRRSQLAQYGEPLTWAEIGIVYDDPYVVILRDLVEFPSGSMNGYMRMFHRADLEGKDNVAVAVLPVLDGKIYLLHQFRHATRQWYYEIPRGFGEHGIATEDQARNELREEIDGEIEELVDLGLLYLNTGLEATCVNLFYARLKSVGKPSDFEGIESSLSVSIVELEDLIASGKITDSFTIAAYTRAKLNHLI